METDGTLNLLEDEIEGQILRLEKSSKRNKRLAWSLKIASIAFAALITVLLGLTVENEQVQTEMKNIALVLGVFITLANAYDAFFNHRSLWIRQRTTLARLYDLKLDLQFYVAGSPPEEIKVHELMKFKSRLTRIRQDDFREWLKSRTEEEKIDVDDEEKIDALDNTEA